MTQMPIDRVRVSVVVQKKRRESMVGLKGQCEGV